MRIAGWLLTLSSIAADGRLQGSEIDAPLLAALQSRRLDSLTSLLAESMLADERLSEDRRALAAAEYAAQLAVQASETTVGSHREKLWRKADEVLTSSLDKIHSPLTRSSIEFQRAVVDAARADWQREWTQLHRPGVRDDQTIADLRRSLQRLTKLADEVDRRTAANAPQSTGAAARTLQMAIRYQWAAAANSLAQALASDDPSRPDLLAESARRLDAPAEAWGGLAFRAGRERAASLRLANRFDEAAEVLRMLDSSAKSEQERDDLTADRAELLLARKQPEEALALLRADGRRNLSPRKQYLLLAALLKQADPSSGGALKPQDVRAEALAQQRRLEQISSGAWARRGELLTADISDRNAAGASTDLRRAAETTLCTGDDARAAVLFEKAAKDPRAAPEAAAAMNLQAAHAWRRTGKYVEAARTYAVAAEQTADPLIASDALLRAADATRLAYRQDRDAARLAAAEALLQQHRRRSLAQDAGDREWLAGEIWLAADRWNAAASAFAAVPADDPRRAAALVLAARCRFQAVRRTSKTTDASLADAVELLRRFSEETAALETATAQQKAETQLYYAELLLDPRVLEPTAAEESLRRLLSNSPPHDVLVSARRLLIYSLALQPGKEQQAENAAEALAGASVDELAQTLQLLHPIASAETEPRREAIGKAEGRLLDLVQRRGRSNLPESRVAVETARVLANWSENDAAAAAECRSRLEQLRVERPRDPLVLEALALLAMKSRRYEAAVSYWQTLASGLSKGTSIWYRAQLNWIVCLRRTGRMRQALSNLESLEVLHPELGGRMLRRRFEEEKRLLRP